MVVPLPVIAHHVAPQYISLHGSELVPRPTFQSKYSLSCQLIQCFDFTFLLFDLVLCLAQFFISICRGQELSRKDCSATVLPSMWAICPSILQRSRYMNSLQNVEMLKE